MKKRAIFKDYSRRSVMKTLGVAAASPFIPVLTADAQANVPKRVIFIVTPNGLDENIEPTGSGANYQMGSALSVLEPLKEKVCYLHGIDMQGRGDYGLPNSHPAYSPHLLTAALTRPENEATADDPTGVYHATDLSIDQVLSNRLMSNAATQTRLPYVFAGAKTNIGNFHHLVYRQAGKSLDPIKESDRLFQTMLGDAPTGGSDPETARLQAEKKSIIDYVKAEIAAVRGVISVEDRHKMDDHLDAVRELERRLDFDSTTAVACQNYNVKDENGADDALLQSIGRNMQNIIRLGMACDQTRVATLMWSNFANGTKFKSKGLDTIGHHSYTHSNEDGDFSSASKKEARRLIAQWYGEQFENFVRRIDETPENGGSMLDNTLLVWTSEHSNYGQHNRTNIPYVIAGNLDGAIRQGRMHNFSSSRRNIGDVYTTIAHAMGYTDINHFGDATYSQGVLPGVLA